MNRLLLCVIMMCATGFASGQKIAAKKSENLVPTAVEQKFVLEYPEIKARWKQEAGLYKAIFVNPVNNLGYINVYDSSGRVVARERELERSEYPPLVSEYLTKKYPAEGFAVWKSTDSLGKDTYYSPRAEETIRFDNEGRVMNKHTATIADSLLSPAR